MKLIILERLAKNGEYRSSNLPANSLFVPGGYSISLGPMSEQEQTDFWGNENQNWQSLVEYLSRKR